MGGRGGVSFSGGQKVATVSTSSSNTVLGKYRILREIARSNDIVYEAIDPQMNRRVAIKELQLPLHLAGAQKRERVERFYREAKAAGTLTHPNIVTIHEVGQENDRHFLVMEYLEGQSLRDILQLQGALPLKETVDMALQLCDALGYAHAHGVVHRDVKPDNVHILPGGTIKLTDFGIARITAEPSITSQGQVFGTPSYMSPEQVASQMVDHRTDLFSLGITLYEMLTGRKPFVGDSVITITYNIMNVQPAMPVGVPSSLQAILQKALAKDPALRYQNAAQLATDLRAEKFALASVTDIPDAPRTSRGPLTFATPGLGGTMDTGTVPSSISGLPAMSAPAGGGQPHGGTVSNGASPAADPVRRAAPSGPVTGGLPFSPNSGGVGQSISLLLSMLGLLFLLGLIVWGIVTAYHKVQTHNQRAEAARLYVNAAQAQNNGNYDAAIRGYQAAQDAAPSGSPESERASQGLSAIQTAQGQKAAQTGNALGAADAYQRAIALNAKNAAAYDALGNLRWNQRDWDGALQAWEGAVRADATSTYAADARSNATQVYMARAQAAADNGNWAQARVNWQAVIAINPGSPEATEAQGRIAKSPLPGSH